VSVLRRFSSRSLLLDAAILAALAIYLFVVRIYGVAETLWMLADQIRDWRLALGPFTGLPLTGPSSTAGGSSLGPIYYWVLWISRLAIGPWTSNLPHAGVYGIAALQTIADGLLFCALRRRSIGPVAAAGTVLLGATVSMDLAITATIWNPGVSVAMVKLAIALRIWSPGPASPLRMIATTAAAWFAVQAHSAALFVAAPVVASFPLEQLFVRRIGGALQAIRTAAEVVLVLQVPFLVHAFAGSTQAVPARFLASASESLGEQGHLRLADAGRSILFESGYIFGSPQPQIIGVVFLVVGCVMFTVRYWRDFALFCATIAPPLCAWIGFSLWRGNYDSYWYLPLVPCLAVASGLGVTAFRSGITSVLLLALVLVAQPYRILHSHSWLRMPQYGPLVRGSQAVIKHANPVRRLDTTFALPPLSDRHFPFEAMGGRFSDDAPFDAVIDERGEATFRQADR
jgi:hypothetical protein